MAYADVFLIPIPKKNLPAYKKMARMGARLWKRLGAKSYYETIGDDLNLPWAGPSFTKAAKCKPGEVVIAAWILYKSKAHRKQVTAKMLKDPAMQKMPKKMPFDMKRMSCGGFKVLVGF